MKKIDKLILIAFTGPFVLIFLVVVFILLSRHMLVYFDDIIGKDLGWNVLSQLLFYFAVFMMPVALPLAVLLSSLLAFGNLGEQFELTAMKSAGISLLRALQPIFVVVLFLTGFAFHINNYLVPEAALQAYSLMYDIKQKKPALDLKEGIFYNGLTDISIKVNRKFSDGITLKDIVLYDHRADNGNREVIIADSGRMSTILQDHYLKFELFNGYNYAEGIPVEREFSAAQLAGTENLSRKKFNKYQVVIDLASFNLPVTSRQAFQNHRLTRNLVQLSRGIDTLENRMKQHTVAANLLITKAFLYYPPGVPRSATGRIHAAPAVDSLHALTPDAVSVQNVTSRVRQVKSAVLGSNMAWQNYQYEKIGFEVQWNRIIANSCMCIAMFLIGAPLGAIIKRGGLGMPFLVSIVFFVVYYVFTMQGEKLAVQGTLGPVTGVWLPAGIFLFIGVYLLSLARRDARLFDADTYSAFRKHLDRLMKSFRFRAKDRRSLTDN